MRDSHLQIIAGVAAVAGACLRAALIVPAIGRLADEPIYFLVDALLVTGLIGLFTGFPRFRTALGAAGFLGALLGFLVIRTGSRLLGEAAYSGGSALLALGLAVAGLSLLREGGLARWAAASWLVSLAAGLGALALAPQALNAVAVACFALGFGLAGLELARRAAQ